MAADVDLIKLPTGTFAPVGDESTDWAQSVKTGERVHGSLRRRRERSYPFHKKFFALVGIAYDIWSELYPPKTVKIRQIDYEVHTDKERFRKDLTILAGYFEAFYNIKGEVKVEAKSISFDSMEQEEFEALYSSCINVVLTKILTNTTMTEAQLRARVDEIMRFDG